jgi:putative DNA primase/helicase
MTDPRLALFNQGYTDLVSVAPPGAPITAGTSLKADDLGKRPAKKGHGGWYGYNWLHAEPSRAEVEAWIRWNANVGLRGTNFPALDIDVLDPEQVAEIRAMAIAKLGRAPVRVGKAPKELLVYRLEGEPFKRAAVKLPGGGLVEVLGDQRQYLVYGQHPSGATYTWKGSNLWDLTPAKLSGVSQAAIEDFLQEVADRYGGEIVGRHQLTAAEIPEQEDLAAPSLDALRAVVEAIPNTFEDRDDYIAVGLAIKAAGQQDEDLAFALFADWCERWEAGYNEPEVVRGDWRRMHPPFRIGWDYLTMLAGPDFNEAVHTFTADPDYEPPKLDRGADDMPVDYTDDWCAEQILPLLQDKLRYDYPNDRWHVWDGARWAHATMGEQEREVLLALRRLARILRAKARSLEGKAQKSAYTLIAKLGNTGTLTAVTRILQSDPTIAVGTDAFDTEGWEINTPAGTVDLKTGEIREHDPTAMHSKTTAVAPRPGRAPLWEKFIEEVTGGDRDLARFMQKNAGYALTGVRREQTLNFVWGPGGNGKSVFVDALMAILDEYAATAPMDTFASSRGDKHPTDLAGLMGARLVTATETQAGRSWDEQRIKAITGGDRMRARFMRQDFVEFTPRFKLILVGNHEPQIENVDEAMRRRIHIVPFTYRPPKPDLQLPEKLEAEYPQILRWMIDGCLLWQAEGLEPPEAVLLRTQQYFEEEDRPRQWLEDNCIVGEGTMAAADAYRSWKLWCMKQGEESGTQRDFTKSLRPLESEYGFQYKRVGPTDRRVRGWHGVSLIENPSEIRGEI